MGATPSKTSGTSSLNAIAQEFYASEEWYRILKSNMTDCKLNLRVSRERIMPLFNSCTLCVAVSFLIGDLTLG